jgi:hypothetical protein
MLKRPKHSKNEVVVPKEEDDDEEEDGGGGGRGVDPLILNLGTKWR